MEPKGRLTMPDPHDLRAQCKKQTSEAELAEARKKGRYQVLPPADGTRGEEWEEVVLWESSPK